MFTQEHVVRAIDAFLEYGEQLWKENRLLDGDRVKGSFFAESMGGWAARCLRFHREQLVNPPPSLSAAALRRAEMVGYINGLQYAGNLKTRVQRGDEGSRVLNDIRAQIDAAITAAYEEAK
jgi:hypothetical protein